MESLREAYLEQGLPRHPKKAAERQAQAQGALVDGELGLVCTKPAKVKVAKYVALTLQLLATGSATQPKLLGEDWRIGLHIHVSAANVAWAESALAGIVELESNPGRLLEGR